MLPHPVAVGTFISAGRSLETALQRVERAEALGYESVYTTHIAGRDSLIVLAAYASRTERIKLGTGVLPIYSRTPVASAQAAATIDELSGGRMVLGLGVAHQVTVENWFGTTIGKPVREMRDYAGIVRAIFRGEDPPQSERFHTRFRFMGYAARPDLPLYIAALSPAMLRLAGQIGDGVMLWLCNPNYIRDVVVPEVTEGRKRAGKTLEGFDVVAAVPAAITEDMETARASLRSELIPYFSLPFYRAMIERSGFGDEIGAFDEAMQRGAAEAAAAAISDRFLEQLTAIGSAADAEASVRRYLEAGATSPCLGGVPKTDFDATLQALAGLTPSAPTARAR
jgi:alkanesulfonate monooxygenase SsuD/methylene tetrahydromethanopterin reductase-like flavin-dependent oxidoreductase (luciferase family)